MSVACRGVGMSAWLVWGLLVLGGISSLQADNGEDLDWWQTAVVYQIYPRSFKDSNGDGVGDLNGINQMVGYLKDLGVSAVWLSPIYPSPGKDFGYDISDYKSIDPLFGTMEDFDNLTATLQDANIKLILDFVPNHSSDQHAWFLDSSKDKNAIYSDYYVWKECQPDVPPNNWLSNFDGSAWEYVKERNQCYLHQFLKEQPDLNYRNDSLKNEMKGVLKFWLDKNVDGFRMDAVYTIIEDERYLNESLNSGCTNASSYGCLNHTYTSDQSGTYQVLAEFRKLLDEYSEKNGTTRIIMTESYTHNWQNLMKYYNFEGLPVAHFPFNFMVIMDIHEDSTAKDWVNLINNWYLNANDNWSNWVMGNHDQHRVGTRLGQELVDAVNMVALLLKGTAVTYNGEEIGMLDSFVRWDQAKDPQGIRGGPDAFPERSRDPQRGPFLWNDTANAGFTNASQAWLPVHSSYWHNNAMMQQQNNRSHLNVYKRMVKLRQTYLWKEGNCTVVELTDGVVGIFRWAADNPTIMGLMNLGADHVKFDLQAKRSTLPKELYVYAASENLDDLQFGQAVNSTDISLPPKAALTLISQPLDFPLKVNSTSTIFPSTFE